MVKVKLKTNGKLEIKRFNSSAFDGMNERDIKNFIKQKYPKSTIVSIEQ